ncbi:hypothetical protein V2J23_03925 [Geobacillus thermoleovorans]|uniref:hypothetical protein n=1 Tax=Geobacillus thermoleovorans TaxID=33941 RepID=UPI00155F3BDB|nr:hypothetical protein [Geobacillus sp. MMMUD3]
MNTIQDQWAMAELKHRLLVIIMQLKDDPAFTKDDAATQIPLSVKEVTKCQTKSKNSSVSLRNSFSLFRRMS